MSEEKWNIIKEKFSTAILTEGKNFPEIEIHADNLYSLCDLLKNQFSFDYQFNMTAVDKMDYFILVYHLENSETKECVVVKTKITEREEPLVDTVCDIWPSSEFFEREVFDLFCIKFKNHPNLKRIFLEDDWQGYPLRKDYKDDINISER